MSAKDVPVRRPTLLQGVLQGPGNMFLPDDLGEFLRTILPGQNLIAHGVENLQLYVMPMHSAWPQSLLPGVMLIREAMGFLRVPSCRWWFAAVGCPPCMKLPCRQVYE